MKKLKLFIENFLVYGLGGVISKVIPLIMVPIVTRLMPNSSYFGISDLSNTVISLCSALAIMGMYDAMYRMFFEKENDDYKKDICSTALIFTVGTSIVVFLCMVFLRDYISEWFFGDKQYSYLVYITAIATLVGSTNSIISAPTRMQNKRKIFLIMNMVSPILSYSISIPMLLAGHYIIALPLAALVSGLTMEVTFGILNHNWFSIRRFNKKYLKELLMIAIPLLPNFLIYWIFNSSDRIMITNFLSVGESGIYSIGSKLGLTSQLIYTAFAGGWQYFAFSTMKEDNQVKSNSKIFEYLGIISYISTVFIFALAKPIYELIFTGEYVRGFIVSPYLFLAPLLQMLFQVASNQFLVIKKTWPNLFILSSGAIINIILNLILVPTIGIEGAAIATLVGYAISDVIVVIVLIKMKLMVISGRFIVSTIGMISFILLWRFVTIENILISCIMAVIYASILVSLYIGNIKKILLDKNTNESTNLIIDNV